MPAHRKDSITVDFRCDRELWKRFKAALTPGVTPSAAIRVLIDATVRHAHDSAIARRALNAGMPEDEP